MRMKRLQLLPILAIILAISCEDTQAGDSAVATKDKNCTGVVTSDEDDEGDVNKNIFATTFSEENDALEVLELLKDNIRRFSVKKLFKFNGMRQLRVRSNLPYVKEYIRDKVDQFHQLDLRLVFKLLSKIGQVLRVAYAGCKGHDCEGNVYVLMSTYLDLITKTRRLSKNMVIRCITSLEYHWYAYYKMAHKNKAIAQLKRTIPLASIIRNESRVVVKETQHLTNLSKDAYGQVSHDLKLTRKEAQAFKDKKKKYKEEEIQYKEDVDRLKKQVGDYRDLIANITKEEAKIDTEEEFVRKKSITSEKCVLVESDQFKEVCNSVFVLFVGVTDCKIIKGKTTTNDCRQYLDKSLFDFRKEQLRNLSKLRKELRDKRLKIAQQKLKVQLKQREQFSALQKVGKKLAELSKEEVVRGKHLKMARHSLDLASSAMIIVQSQLIKMVDFWENVILHTNSIVREARENATDDDVDFLKERIMTSGFSWLALGKVLRIAHHELTMTSELVAGAFMRFPTTKEVSNVIKNEAEEILKTTIQLASKYTKRIRETEDKIRELICKEKTGAT